MASSVGTATDLSAHEYDDRRTYLHCKRLLDVVFSLAALVVLSPAMLLVAVLIKLTDLGPVFFVHTRIGQDGIPFNCIKFRSMHVNAERMKEDLASESQHEDNRTFKIARDPRVTWIGRFIRKASIDELPQLWNVVMGDMSLVGPRPPCPQEVAFYNHRDWQRLTVKPGLTCFWQIQGRGDIPFDRQVEMDLDYVQQRNMWLDVKLIFWTIPAVISAKGAY